MGSIKPLIIIAVASSSLIPLHQIVGWSSDNWKPWLHALGRALELWISLKRMSVGMILNSLYWRCWCGLCRARGSTSL